MSEAETDTRTWCIFVQHYPRVQGGGVASFVSDMICADGWFATGLAQLEIIFAQTGKNRPIPYAYGVIQPFSAAQMADWDQYLFKLPKYRFERTRRRIAITLRGDTALDDLEDLNLFNTITLEQMRIGADMVLRGLQFVQTKLKPRDTVDLSQVIAATEALSLRDWESDSVMRADLHIACAKNRVHIDGLNPWSKVDLSGSHPNARSLLDMASDWDQANDFAPHGNDLGADILGGWEKIAGSSIEQIAAIYEVNLSGDTGPDALDRIRLLLAVCFANVKRKGRCEAGLAKEALAIVAADRERAVDAVIEDSRLAFLDAVNRYADILRPFAEARQ